MVGKLITSDDKPVNKGDALTRNGKTVYVTGWNRKDVFVVCDPDYPPLHAMGFAHSAYELTYKDQE